jgi:hypothetical protein
MKTLFAVFLLLASIALRAEEPALSPKEYVTLHHSALTPASPEWKGTMEKLSKSGDGFTVEHLKQLSGGKLNDAEKALIASVTETVTKRAAAETDAAFVKNIQPRLERAALVDVSCDGLEATLPAWALKSITENNTRPGVMDELKRIGAAPAPKNGADPFAGVIAARSKAYVARIIAAPSADKVGGATIPGVR